MFEPSDLVSVKDKKSMIKARRVINTILTLGSPVTEDVSKLSHAERSSMFSNRLVMLYKALYGNNNIVAMDTHQFCLLHYYTLYDRVSVYNRDLKGAVDVSAATVDV